jgi:hypothetical protein
LSLTLTPTQFTNEDYVKLSHAFAGGDISKATKSELERFAVMLSRPQASEHFDSRSFPQVCETVRLLLLVRISEEANIEALRNSNIALRVALAALVIGLIQTIPLFIQFFNWAAVCCSK